MKIIAKVKDYYDYLQGVNGIDPMAVFDRRKCFVVKNSWYNDFSTRIERKHTGYDSTFGLIVGNTFYVVGGMLTDKIISGYGDYAYYELKYEIVYSREIENKTGRPLIYTPYVNRTYDQNTKTVSYSFEWGRCYMEEYPLFRNTNIPALIDANTMFTKIQDYILANKEKVFVDTRTDVEKLESAGFDKVSSFRKM